MPGILRNITESHQKQHRYQITDNSKNMKLRVCDITRREVKDLTGQVSVIGHQLSVKWSGVDDANRILGSGVYFVKLDAGGYCATEKLLLIR